jgi:hypothetical protein
MRPMFDFITENTPEDQLDRRGFLKCLALAGRGDHDLCPSHASRCRADGRCPFSGRQIAQRKLVRDPGGTGRVAFVTCTETTRS